MGNKQQQNVRVLGEENYQLLSVIINLTTKNVAAALFMTNKFASSLQYVRSGML
jgi:hypothetical protein